MGKRKKVKCGKKKNEEKCSQPVMENDTLPSSNLPTEKTGTNSHLVSHPKSDYNITFTTRGENVIGTIYWKVGKIYDLEDDKQYICHLPHLQANCCNVWLFAVQKSSKSLIIAFASSIHDRNVTFTILLGNNVYKTSPLLRVEAKEKVNGIYTGTLLFSTLERYQDELTQELFTLKCQMMLYVSDLTRSEYPHTMCSCSNLTKQLGTLYEKNDYSDLPLRFGNYTHRCILAARCPGLRKELLRIPDIISALRVPLLDIPEETFKQVLQYIYTGTTPPLSVDTAIELIYTSASLGLLNLETKCHHFLKMKLSKNNFLKIYSLAILRNSRSLKIAAEAFVVKNTDLIESLNSDNRNLIAPSFVTMEEFENVKSSLTELFGSVQN